MVDYLRGFLSPSAPRNWAQDDRFDPVDNPLGNLVPNSLLIGSGKLAEGLTIDHAEGVTHQLVSRPDRPSNWQEISMKGGEHVVTVLGDNFINPLPAGAWVQASCEVDVDAHDSWRDISLILEDGSPDGLASQALAPFNLTEHKLAAFPHEAWSGVLKTPPIKLKTPRQNLMLRLSLQLEPFDNTGVLRFTTPELRQIGAPVL